MADSPPPQRNPDLRPADADHSALVTVGDRTAFGELYDRYGKPAYSLARRICPDPDLAEDVVQEAFLAVWHNPSAYDRSRGGFGTWPLTVVHHRAVGAVRRENAQSRRSGPLSDEVSERNVTPAEGADRAALAFVAGAEVREALQRLPEDRRQLLTPAYLGGYTQIEVAALQSAWAGRTSDDTTGAQR